MRRPPRTLSASQRERLSRWHRRWSPEEDEQLRNYVAEHGENDWRFAEDLFKRPRRACRLRWQYCLRTTVTQHPLSDEEKARILQLYDMLGAKWDTLRSRTQGDYRFPVPRTECDIKNYIDQVLIERAGDQDHNLDEVNDNDGNLQAPEENIDGNNGEGSSHGNQSLDLSLSLSVSPSVARNIDLNAPAPSNDAPD